ncbi:28S ribosomal protein S23, mitochondrial isoform X2 [Ceratina calcarata]|nr:28S ribosomal protein S23, mitochondrial isoform X2 [Ceratina calcarata]
MKEENTPIWYDVYKAFPPTLEPRYSRRPPPKEIQRILYEEDEIRAKLHKEIALPAVNLKSNKVSHTQIFLTVYNSLIQGGLTKEKAYDQALDSYKIIFNQEKYVLTKEPRKEDQLTNSN